MPANLTLVAADALNCDWQALVADPSDPSRTPPFKVVGNIPYAITSPLIEKALEPPAPALVVFLVQRDVAERVAAHSASKSYGALSVGVQAVASVERLFAVKAGSFSPPPRVESALLRLVPLVKPLISAAERTNFRRFVTTLFSQRRKQLQRILRSALGMTRSEVDRVVSELALDPACRPEVLAPEELVRLFRATGR